MNEPVMLYVALFLAQDEIVKKKKKDYISAQYWIKFFPFSKCSALDKRGIHAKDL